MKYIGAGIATVGIWASIAFIAYVTKSTDHVGWGVGATLFVWISAQLR